jgi:GDP-D-mannose dehydratase
MIRRQTYHEPSCQMAQIGLITSADDFFGSHLTELLVRNGYQVKALYQDDSFNDRGWLENVESRNHIEVHCGDVRDSHYCKQITKGVDTVATYHAHHRRDQ